MIEAPAKIQLVNNNFIAASLFQNSSIQTPINPNKDPAKVKNKAA